MKIMVSACLLGENCKYNGRNNLDEGLRQKLSGHEVIPVCPELEGGLPVPRVPAEIVSGRVVTRDGADVDSAFRLGAEKVLETAKRENPDLIILKSGSPSCGVNEICDGTFSGRRIPGRGIFAELAVRAGFRVMDSEDADRRFYRLDRIERVEKYERLFDEAAAAPDAEKLRLLEGYYTSGQWREDYEADERGELPPGLKRGVLSQDALYDLLERNE